MWYLESLNKNEIVFNYLVFNENEIKKDLFNYFKDNKEDELWLYKENNNVELVGDDFISVFLLVENQVAKEIYRGNRTFYKKVRKPI